MPDEEPLKKMIKEFGKDPEDSTRHIDYGSNVDEGTILAHLDSAPYGAEVAQAGADVLRAQSGLSQMQAKHVQAELDWARAQQLMNNRAIAKADFDLARASYDVARANIEDAQAAIAQAQARLDKAKINFGYTTIRSPVKGVIVDRRVNVGQTVVASLAAPSLFLIAKDLKKLQVWASVNEADIGRIRVGQSVSFTVDAFPGETFIGSVFQVRLNASMTQNVVTYTVVVNTDNAKGKLLPYLTANLKFEIGRRHDVLLVPNAALRWQPQLSYIVPELRDEYARAVHEAEAQGIKKSANAAPSLQERGVVWVTEKEFVRPVEVQLGLTDGILTEIVSGDLREGQAVVIGEALAAEAEETASPFTPRPFKGK